MFWKTMAILWTVLLLVLAGAAVQFVRTAQPGSSKVEVSLKGPAKGTQATAILSNVPCEEAVLMPALLNLTKTDTTGKSAFSMLSKDLQDKSLKDLQRCISVRRLGGDMTAIDVRSCKSDQQARELARAVADSYIQLIRKTKTNTSNRTIKLFTDERDSLQNRLRILRREIVSLCRGAPTSVARGQKIAPLIRLENITQELVEARSEMIQAEYALKFHQKEKDSMSKDPRVREAMRFDRILQHLRIGMIDAKAGLIAFPSDLVKKAAITTLEREYETRRKEVLEHEIETIGMQAWMSHELARKRVADLMERKTAAKAEARDLMRTLSTIDDLESGKKDLEEMLSKVEQRLMEMKMKRLEGVPELIGILP